MAGTSAFGYKFRKKNMTITINTNASFNTEDRGRGLTLVIFFQRLIFIIQPEEVFIILVISYVQGQTQKDVVNETHKPEFNNVLFDQLGLSVIYLISFEILILFLMVDHCCKDVHGLLEVHSMKYDNSSKTIF